MKALFTIRTILVMTSLFLLVSALPARGDVVLGLGNITATGDAGTILTLTYNAVAYDTNDLVLGETKIYNGGVEANSTYPPPGADDFDFNQTVHSLDGLTHLETMFNGLYTVFFVFENNGNDDANWYGIDANDNLTTGVWVDASATAVDTGYNTGVGNQNLKGYVFTTDVPSKGIRIEGRGFDAYSISALPEPGAITLLALGGLGVLLRRRRRA